MSALPSTFKAWQSAAYDEDPAKASAALKLADLPIPTPGKGQVLIKVHFAAVNPIDWKLFTGGYKDMFPLPLPYVPGFDAAGVVVAVGPEVTKLQVGDRVATDTGLQESCVAETTFGPCGAFAEYVVSPESQTSKVPSTVPLAAVAGLPLAGLTSYQALFTGGATSLAGEPLADVKEGDKVLVLGGASGTGHLAIQLAKIKGATVATTASPNTLADGRSKLEWVKVLGADVVINYKEEDWAKVLKGQGYDLIYDCVGAAEDLDKAAEVLRPGGQFISIANFASTGTRGEHHFKVLLLRSIAADLDHLVKWVAEGKLSVHVDKIFPFAETREALAHSVSWKSTGKVLIDVAGEPSA